MSFDIYLQWHEHGESGGIPVDRVRASFGSALVAEHDGYWRLHYGQGEEPDVDIGLHDTSTDLATALSVNRPCQAEAFWNAIFELLSLDHAVLFFPGGPLLVTSADTREHLPASMIESMGEPHVVHSGREIVAEITAA